MTLTEQATVLTRKEIDELIVKAIKKVKVGVENDLCKYLPGPTGGYMHHFTLRKLKNIDPMYLNRLLQQFIFSIDAPRRIDPKQRAPRGSKKRRDFIHFTKTDIDRVLELARQVGDKELVSRFSPKKPLPVLKRDLIRSIRHGLVNIDLWNAYVEIIKATECQPV